MRAPLLHARRALGQAAVPAVRDPASALQPRERAVQELPRTRGAQAAKGGAAVNLRNTPFGASASPSSRGAPARLPHTPAASGVFSSRRQEPGPERCSPSSLPARSRQAGEAKSDLACALSRLSCLDQDSETRTAPRPDLRGAFTRLARLPQGLSEADLMLGYGSQLTLAAITATAIAASWGVFPWGLA